MLQYFPVVIMTRKAWKNITHAEIDDVNKMETLRNCSEMARPYINKIAMIQQRGVFYYVRWGSWIFLKPWDDKPSSLKSYLGEKMKKKNIKTLKWTVYSWEKSLGAAYHWVNPFDISSPLKSTSTCKKRRKEYFGTVIRTDSAARSRNVQELPSPKALCVWTGCSLHSSLLHPAFSCGAPPWKHWTQICKDTDFTQTA